ncbi:MFS transporter [Parafrankia sp. FMc2]|uniref:MFS transporter n=1 Tax=Parafrankia sp. FMc2 TaxID=3233196 RepID=UPI0034D55810
MNRGYHRLLAAAALSNLGDGIRLVAVPLVAVASSDDPLVVAGLTAAGYLPWALFGLPIGALVDRHRPEKVMAAANASRLLLLIALALVASSGTIPLLVSIVFVLGVGEAAYDNAAQSLLPRLVADSSLEHANGRLVTLERTGQDVIGPALAGLLVAWAVGAPFAVNAVLLAVALALLAGIRTPPPPAPAEPTRLRREVTEGVNWLWQSHPVRRIVLAGAVLTFLTMFWESTLVLLAVDRIGLSTSAVGWMLAIGALGGTVGGLATPRIVSRVPAHDLLPAVPLCCGVAVLALAAWPTAVLAGAAWGLTGFTFSVWNVLSTSLRQRTVPAGLLGRVNAANRVISMIAVPAGAVAGGAVAAALTLTAPLWGSAAGLLALGTALLAHRAEPVAAPVTGPGDRALR